MLQRLKENGSAAFEPETVRILTGAFDEAWLSIQNSGIIFTSPGQTNAMREILALAIIQMARFGERDQRRLRNDALLHLTEKLRTKNTEAKLRARAVSVL